MLKGYSLPLSPKGSANIVPKPPWHYVGRVVAIEYEAEKSLIQAYLPDPLAYDSNRCCVYFIDWQYASENGKEYLNPVDSQYKETIILMSASYKGESLAYCPYIWVSQDKALLRGMFQGWPKQFGVTHVTKRFLLESKAAPMDICAGTLSVAGERYIEGRVTLEGHTTLMPRPSFAGSALMRYFPDLQAGKQEKPLVKELVQLKSKDITVGPIKTGHANLKFLSSEFNEVSDFKPRKILAGYEFEVALTVDDLKPLETM